MTRTRVPGPVVRQIGLPSAHSTAGRSGHLRQLALNATPGPLLDAVKEEAATHGAGVSALFVRGVTPIAMPGVTWPRCAPGGRACTTSPTTPTPARGHGPPSGSTPSSSTPRDHCPRQGARRDLADPHRHRQEHLCQSPGRGRDERQRQHRDGEEQRVPPRSPRNRRTLAYPAWRPVQLSAVGRFTVVV